MQVAGKRIADVVNRMHVAVPKARDGHTRPAVIPAGVAEARARRAAGDKRKTEKDLQEELGGAGGFRVQGLNYLCLGFCMGVCVWFCMHVVVPFMLRDVLLHGCCLKHRLGGQHAIRHCIQYA